MKNTFIAWQAILNYGFVLSILFTAVVLISYIVEPLVWATDFPKEVQKQIGEIPPDVLPKALAVMFTIIGLTIVCSVLMNRSVFRDQPNQASFWSLSLNAFLLLNFMNLFDVIVVDILIFNTIQPDFMWIEGAEDYIREHVTLTFHFIAFFKGQPYMLAISVIAAGISKVMVNRYFKKTAQV